MGPISGLYNHSASKQMLNEIFNRKWHAASIVAEYIPLTASTLRLSYALQIICILNLLLLMDPGIQLPTLIESVCHICEPGNWQCTECDDRIKARNTSRIKIRIHFGIMLDLKCVIITAYFQQGK